MLDGIEPKNEWERAHHQTVWEKPKRRFPRLTRFRFGLAFLMLLLLVAGIFAGVKVVTFASKIIESGPGRMGFGSFFLGADKELVGEEEGEIRVLLLGIGGAGHDGPNLTDTMILATIKLPESKDDKPKVSLISIPRDLFVNVPGYDYRKINSAYAFGQQGGRGGGAALARETVEKIFGVDIPYYGLVDFKGFEKIIDDLGGLDITVDRAFTDSYFPDDREGYLPTLTFESGAQHMDGARALQFVRSRHGTNGEGSDFARSRRQTKVLSALKERVQGINLITNLGLVNRILDDLSDHLRTNLQAYEMKRLYDLLKNLKSEQIAPLSLDVESGLICDLVEEETQAYIILPCAGQGQYGAIREFYKNQFAIRPLTAENPAVEIQNAAGIDLLGQEVKTRLASGLSAGKITIGNFRGTAAYEQSIIYDNTRGAKPETLKFLKSSLGLRAAQSPFPFPTTSVKPDFVIVAAPDIKDKFK